MVQTRLETVLACPHCGTALQSKDAGTAALKGELLEGELVCEKHHTFPVKDGIAAFCVPLKNKYEEEIFGQFYLQTHYRDWIAKAASKDQLATFDLPGFFTRGDSSYYTDLFTIFGGVLSKASTVVDLGCSVGRLTFECARHAGQVIGIDPSQLHIRHARDILRTKELHVTLGQSQNAYAGEKTLTLHIPVMIPTRNVEFFVGDDASLPFADASIDMIISSAVIDRVLDAEVFIRHCSRILKPHGHILLTAPFNWQEIFTPPEKWLGKGGYGTPNGSPEKALDALMKCHGYRRIRAQNIPWQTHCDQRYFFMWSIYAALFQKI
ncbi:MAG: hypothetical protein Greene041662_1040 [Candidatus Peregrinibacteria bacterium Greene0416_62]|nr:MAG: hypothetical protein Greene041662_1040 [Candidatus Peregrinibacteria bacterium Greene0416_62]TSC97375.1 MAG: hypothetical protein Greene101449_1226 [Candidatus Peregrinibacteria bacterium Greene1014_49]